MPPTPGLGCLGSRGHCTTEELASTPLASRRGVQCSLNKTVFKDHARYEISKDEVVCVW